MAVLEDWATQSRWRISQMTPGVRLLLASLLVSLLIMFWLVAQYSAAPAMVPIGQFAIDRQAEVAARLHAAGIRVQAGETLHVPADQHLEAISLLQQANLLDSDTSRAFDLLIANQSPWQSSTQSAQAFQLAKQQVLAQIISKMAHVRQADVLLSVPEKTGFGRSYARPGASVNVVMQQGHTLSQPLAMAIAGLVSGAVSQMQPQDVVVIEANRGRQFTIKDPDDLLPDQTLDFLHSIERYHRDKILSLLSYIPGVLVAVNVRPDPIVRRETQEYEYDQAPLLSSETRHSRQSGQPVSQAFSNTHLDLSEAQDLLLITHSQQQQQAFGNQPLTRRSQVREMGRFAQQINVTVNVPRQFFVDLYHRTSRTTQPPDEAALKALADRELERIVAQIQPMITAESVGQVTAHMIPDLMQARLSGVMPPGIGPAGAEPPANPAGGAAQHTEPPADLWAWAREVWDWQALMGWLKPAALGAGAMLLLAVLWRLVRNTGGDGQGGGVAGPAVAGPVGYAASGEGMQSRGIDAGGRISDAAGAGSLDPEQINRLVRANPAQAAELLTRWVRSQ